MLFVSQVYYFFNVMIIAKIWSELYWKNLEKLVLQNTMCITIYKIELILYLILNEFEMCYRQSAVNDNKSPQSFLQFHNYYKLMYAFEVLWAAEIFLRYVAVLS